MIDTIAIRARFEALSPLLNERARRLFAASEARAAGRGGVTAVSVATGVARSTINRGLSELRSSDPQLSSRIRRPGGGRKPKIESEPGLLDALATLVQSAIRGDPEAALLWVSKSQRHLAGALAELGFTVGQKLVGRLLRRLGFSLQANSKTREGTNHPDRNAQFEYISARINAFQTAGQPTISVDTKKKELVGDFKNGGRELRPKGDPEPVRVHDFAIPGLGKVAPYGVYDIAANSGWINLGITHDTAAFAVESIRRWWQEGSSSISVGGRQAASFNPLKSFDEPPNPSAVSSTTSGLPDGLTFPADYRCFWVAEATEIEEDPAGTGTDPLPAGPTTADHR